MTDEIEQAALLASMNNDVRALKRMLDIGASNIFQITQMARISNSYRVLNYLYERYPVLEGDIRWI